MSAGTIVGAMISVAALSAPILGVADPGDVPPLGPSGSDALYAGGDGLSKKTAVVLTSKGEVAGIRSEYAWISAHYPGSKPLTQALTPWDNDGRRFDRITVRTTSGKSLVLWFDISALYK